MAPQPEIDPMDAIWADDLLGRRKEAEFLVNFLVNRSALRSRQRTKRSYVLNIDADWGQGKSFFLRHLHQHIQEKKFPSVYVDAWKDDFTNEPFTAVMSAIDECVQPYLKEKSGKPSRVAKAFQNVKTNLGQILLTATVGATKKGTGMLIGSAADQIGNMVFTETEATGSRLVEGAEEGITTQVDKLLDKFAEAQIEQFQKAKSSLSDFHTNLSNFLAQFEKENAGEVRLPFFILVDELDRCRPTYSVEMLERIKHLFDVPGMVFVLATNTDQLAHAVQAVYGQSFDGRHYLERFFNRTYKLTNPVRTQIVEYLWQVNGIDETALSGPLNVSQSKEFIVLIDRHFGLSIRQLERVFEIFSALSVMWPDPVRHIDTCVMIPVIVAFVLGKSQRDTQHGNGWLLENLASANQWKFIMTDGSGREVNIATYARACLLFGFTTVEDRLNWIRGNKTSNYDVKQVLDGDSGTSSAIDQQVMEEHRLLTAAQRPTKIPGLNSIYWMTIQQAGRLG